MLRSYKPIPRQSEKGKAKVADFLRMERLVLKRDRYICQARVPDVCTVRAVTCHHIRLRSQGGTNDVDNLASCCRDCHLYIHHNPAWAVNTGMMKRRNPQ